MFAHLLPDLWEEFLQDEKFSHKIFQCFKLCCEGDKLVEGE